MQRHKKLNARILSLALSAAMVFTMMPSTVFAVEGDVPLGASSITECHPAHDEDCGYIEAVKDASCSHLNEDGTYSCAPVLDSGDMSGNAATPSDADKEYVCDHRDGCGYAETTEGVACLHSCEICQPKGSDANQLYQVRAETEAAGATISDVTISGTVGKPLPSGITADLTLTGVAFAFVREEWVTSWFTGLPNGVEVKIEVELANLKYGKLTFHGTPTEASDAIISITIPRGTDAEHTVIFPHENEVIVTSNSNAKFDIKPPKTPASVAITTPPTKTTYTAGESFSNTGMVVTATYGDGSTAAVTEYTVTPSGALDAGTTAVTISYTENNATVTATQAITVNKANYTGAALAATIEELKTTSGAKTYDLATLLSGKTGFKDVTYAVASTTNSAGVLTGDATISGSTLNYALTGTGAADATATVSVTVSSKNLNDVTATITMKLIDKTNITISGLAAPAARKYDGTAILNTEFGTPSYSPTWSGALEYTYYEGTGTGGTKLNNAPKAAGTYTVVAAIPDSDTSYAGNKTITFTIGKKDATVTADNKSIVVGAAKPTYTATASGLATGETISGVQFTDAASDTNTKGTFDITPSGGTITGGNDNYNITYTKGTLTITVATQVIDTAIANANAAKNGITINEGLASSVTNGTKFVTAAEMKALTDAIAVAEAAKSTANTAAEAQAAATALDNAVAAFNAAIKTGTYSGGSSGGGGSSSGGGGSSSGGGSTPITKPTEPVTGNSNTTATVDDKGNATVNVTDKNISDAVQAAKDAANKKGVNTGEVTAVINVTSPANSNPNTVTVNLPKTVQDQIISNKIGNVAIVIDKPDISIGMTLATITEMNKQAKADIQISATRTDATKLSTEVKNAIGNRPAFDLKATYNSGAKSITSFGSGSVSVAIPYTLQKGEVAGGLYAVYVDGNGKVTHLTNSSYDAENKVLRFSTNHFSVYGIGYKAPVGVTDIANHWAKTDIEFVVGRGLMTGTSNTTFSPDGSMTRAMFVTALGRLAGVDTNSYKTSKFTDVKADAYYAPYVNWAASKGITNGTTATTFSPDNTVTRQEMAVFMSNYAKAMGYTVPETRAAVTFADNSAIGSWAATAVKQMQMAGVLNGKNGNKFDPTGTATKAEVAAVLHRYVELVIDRTTTEGWTTNDSGSGMYYQSGKAVTGTKTIGGVAYTFNTYGETTRKTTTAGATTDAALPADSKKTGT